METRKVPKWLIIVFILYSVILCWLGSAYILFGGLRSLPFVSLFHNVKVVDSVLCSGPTENFDPSDLSTFKSPNTLSEVFYCAYLETNVPDSVSIAWFYKDEELAFATGPGQFVNESGYYFFSLKDSIDYSSYGDYNGEFNIDNQISEGALRVHIFDDRNTIKKDTFYLQTNP